MIFDSVRKIEGVFFWRSFFSISSDNWFSLLVVVTLVHLVSSGNWFFQLVEVIWGTSGADSTIHNSEILCGAAWMVYFVILLRNSLILFEYSNVFFSRSPLEVFLATGRNESI